MMSVTLKIAFTHLDRKNRQVKMPLISNIIISAGLKGCKTQGIGIKHLLMHLALGLSDKQTSNMENR